jgi:hypothetical protein
VHGWSNQLVFGGDEIRDLEARGDVDALGPRIPLLGEAGILVVGSAHGGPVSN